MKSKKLFSLLIALLVLLAPAGVVQAQQAGTVSGTVTDSLGDEPLAGVNVVVKGMTIGTATGRDGQYSLSVPSLQDTLAFSFIGYETQDVAIDGRAQIDVVLESTTLRGGEVVVVGYGTQSRETMSTFVSEVDTEVLETAPLENAAVALQGTVAGVRVQQVSGQPGAAPRVVMRGGASINNPNGATPLYVVDGVTREDMNGVPPSSIESIQVLKDAASTAIYGARAANGVVIVTTKRGAANQLQVNYDYSLRLSNLREKVPVLGARDYIRFTRTAAAATEAAADGVYNPGDNYQGWFVSPDGQNTVRGQLRGAFAFGVGNDLTQSTLFTPQYLTPENEHKLDEGWESMPDPLDPSKTIIFKGTDWQDVLFRTGFSQNHNLRLSGGSEAATFSAGIGYMNTEGVAIRTNFDRFSVDLDGDLQVLEDLSVFGGLAFSRETDNQVYSNNQLFERSLALAPTAKRYFEDGSIAQGFQRSAGNPEYYLPKINNDNTSDYMTVQGGADWDLLPGLNLETRASLYNNGEGEQSFEEAYLNRTTLVTSRNASASTFDYNQQEYSAVLNYTDNIKNYLHNINSTIGLSYYDEQVTTTFASGRGAATDLIPTLNASSEFTSISSTKSHKRIIGFFGRINYNYDYRYLITFTNRYDGASNLGAANKWGYFPAMSVGWNLHNERFWGDPLRVSRLKLKASYGVSGNLGNLGYYTAQGAYSVGDIYRGQSAIEYSELANENLTWEESATLNLGLEAGLFENRLRIDGGVYRRVTDNLITALELPSETGFSSILTNLGSLENRGLEVSLGADLISTSEFMWNLSINASRNQNKILKLPENQNENNRIGGFNVWDDELGDYTWKGGLQEGGSMGDLYAYQQIGVYPSDEAAEAGPLNTMRLSGVEENYAGDSAFLDADGNGIIDPRDRRYMGNIYPDWTGGLTSTVAYKGLSLYVRLDYALGHTIFNYVYTSLDGQFLHGVNTTESTLRSWQQEGDVTNVPKFYWADQVVRGNRWMGDPRSGNGAGNSFYYQSGDYLAVRNVTLTYSAPESWVAPIGMSNLSISLTGSNLHYFTSYGGLAPEEGGIDRGRYPLPRTFTLGVNASF